MKRLGLELGALLPAFAYGFIAPFSVSEWNFYIGGVGIFIIVFISNECAIKLNRLGKR